MGSGVFSLYPCAVTGLPTIHAATELFPLEERAPGIELPYQSVVGLSPARGQKG